MQEKIVEILVYLIAELQKNTPLGDIDLNVLSNKGYTPAEISAAFSWLYEKINVGDSIVTDVAKGSPHSHRVLHDAERMVILPDAYGYLIQLREIGLITDLDIELVIDRVMMSGYVAIGIEEIKTLVTFVLAESDDSSNTGSRVMINSQDTIH